MIPPLIYVVQVSGLLGLYYAVRGKPRDLAPLGSWVALAALVASLVYYDAW